MDSWGQPSFTPGELEESLREQSYGLSSYKLLKKSPLESAAEVITLEHETVRISLTQRGYHVSTTPLLLYFTRNNQPPDPERRVRG